MIVGEFLVTSMSNRGLEDGGAWCIGLTQVLKPGCAPSLVYKGIFSCDIWASGMEAQKYHDLMLARKVLRMMLEEATTDPT